MHCAPLLKNKDLMAPSFLPSTRSVRTPLPTSLTAVILESQLAPFSSNSRASWWCSSDEPFIFLSSLSFSFLLTVLCAAGHLIVPSVLPLSHFHFCCCVCIFHQKYHFSFFFFLFFFLLSSLSFGSLFPLSLSLKTDYKTN